ncbi:MAG: PAS domain S-box protein, partial [Chloroflexota bacterium]|nr:PAS domain S-box protein [Chloroflexota bacterium]
PEDIARVLERGEFDLVISDFNAPWWTGLEKLRAVKVRYPERPVIIYTGSATPENLIQALEAGLDDYVLKSSDIDRARLPNAVRIAIGRAWQRRALRESEERFRTMSDFTYDWEYWVGTDGNYVYMSPSCERITGYRAEELASNPHLLEAIVHPGDLATLTQHLRERSDSDEMATLDFRIIRRDGQVRWINHICRKVHSADGRWLGRRASNRDITERKRAEEALRESEERFRALIENATDLVIVLNPDGTGRYVSPSVERILGYPPEELVGTRIADFIHPDDLPAALQAIAYRAQTPGLAGQSSEFRVRHKDGSDRTMEVIGNNLLDDPAVNGIVVNARDITERRRAEESLRESEEKYRSLFANSLDAVLLTMPDGRILAANDAACRMFGSTEQELRQLGRGGVVDTSDPRLAAGLEERARTGKFSGELTLVRKDGTKFPSEMSTAIYMDQTGQKKTSMIIRDITERKRAEEELEHRAEQFALLYDAGLTLNRTLDPRVQLEFLFKIAVKALHADRAEFFRYDPARDALRFEQSIGYAEKGEAEQALRAQSFRNGDERGLVGWVSQNRVPLNVPDVSADPRYIAIDSEIRSGLWVPVERENRLGGVLAVLSARVGAFTPQDERLLALFANQVAVALENARLFEETSRRLKQVQALHAIDVAIGSSLDLRVTLNVFLEQVTALLGIHAAETLLLNPHTHILEYASARGFRTKALQQTHLRLGDGYAGRAALERRTISIANLAEPENRFGRSPLFADEGFVAYYAVPLIAKGYVRGVLELFHRAPFEPDQEWLDFLQTLAGQAAIAIDNASLFDDLQRSNIELGLAYDTTIEGWSRALDLRDKETEGHTQRVTEITMRLARAMGIDDNELVQVRRGALLHDIGKMGVPDSILLKPDKLDDDEWKVMWLHPKLAYDMLSPITYLRPALD